jgi:predicted XRE-type DNA-binding protein
MNSLDTILLARRGHVTQPRMSHIMEHHQLALEIQEALLIFLATLGKPEIREIRLLPTRPLVPI